MTPDEVPPEVRQAFLDYRLREAERTRRFGYGRPIVSGFSPQGHRLVAVGSTVYGSKSWTTVHDFLGDYIAKRLTREWGNAEIPKPFEERHPILQWYHLKCDFDRTYIKVPGKVHTAIMTGPVKAYFSLAYDLYTVDHHSLLSPKLLNRLRNKEQFQGARHELYVYAAFLRAGFDILPENEQDASDSHCEFSATHRQTGSKYSVEAKSRHRAGILGREGVAQPLETIKADVYRLLQDAFKKSAAYERIVFIDVNVPPIKGSPFESKSVEEVFNQINRLEGKQSSSDPWPPAFLFFTNHPSHFVGVKANDPGHTVFFTGFNIPDFKLNDGGRTVACRYPAVLQLNDSVLHHSEIPHEF